MVFPEQKNKEAEFDKITKAKNINQKFSFYRKGLKNGDEVVFLKDKTIVAKIVGEREVEYGGQRGFLPPLVRKIFEDKNQANNSGAYQGAAYFCFDGKKLKDLPDVEL